MLALVGCLLGLLLIVTMWPRRGSSEIMARLRHPSSPLPIAVSLDATRDEAHLRVSNRHAILDTTIDIVTFRRSGSTDPWVSEPIVEPIALSPGDGVDLSSVLADGAASYDVVVAWTVRHLGGDVQGSRTLTVEPATDVAAESAPLTPLVGRPTRGLAAVYVAIAILLGAVMFVAGWRLFEGGSGDVSVAAPPTSDATPPPSRPDPSTPADSPPPPSSARLPASSTVPTTTMPSTQATTTTSTVATGPTTTATTTTTSVAASTTTTATTATTTTSTEAGRRVTIRGSVRDCRFGADCLIAGFELDGFPSTGEYICEFDDGSRFTFRYIGDGGDDACATSGSSPSITIEVDGVRSATITRTSLDGT